MGAWAYFNENNPAKAEWLRELIKDGAIAPGEVDERSIREISPADLVGFAQCHFFAGIGAWSHALRIAGWPDDRPVWTASCPCQPLSAAGKQKGFEDDRHLWPECFRLIRAIRPARLYFEQVASPLGLAWLDLVYDNMESADYTLWTADLCAAGAGAPHIRQRLFGVGKPNSAGCESGVAAIEATGYRDTAFAAGRNGVGMANTTCECVNGSGGEGHRSAEPANGGLLVNTPSRGRGEFGDAREPRRGGHADGTEQHGSMGNTAGAESLPGPYSGVHRGEESRGPRDAELERSGGYGGVTLGDTERTGLEGHGQHGDNWTGWQEQARPIAPAGVTNGYWSGAELIPCTDGKWRPIEPGVEPLADEPAAHLVRVRDASGIDPETEARETFPLIRKARARTLRLRGYGDAIVAELAAYFILATGE